MPILKKKPLLKVVEARASATSTNISVDNLTPAKIQQFQQAQDALSTALSRLMVVVERYPDLKANQSFLDLQAQLEGTENRITVERRQFNESVKEYNAYIKRIPQSFLAGIYGFEEKGYFRAQEGAEQVPTVEF